MSWERARSEEQKEQRITEIIEATARLYEIHAFEEITFVLIAKEARFTRSNLYKYFNSKEEIFMEFLRYDIVRWRKDVEKNLTPDRISSVGDFAAAWVSLQAKHERFIKLLSILHNVIEKNVALDNLTEFKRGAKEELFVLAGVLCRLFPGMTMENAVEFLQLQLAAATGLYQMTDLSEAQQQILDQPEFSVLKIDFTASFQKTVEHLLNGILES